MINRNAAQAIIALMEENGIDAQLMQKANVYLTQAKKNNPHDEKLFAIQEKLNILRVEL